MKNRKKYILQYIIFALVFIISIILFTAALSVLKNDSKEKNVLNNENIETNSYPTVIIDAGHGGEDGGAIGKNGVYEKELNLIISEALEDMLQANGFEVVMTRREDTMLYDKNVDYHGRKKLLDLAERKRIAEQYENAIFISIHMNTFPSEKYRGLQVYYSSNNSFSKSLAESIQISVKETLQNDNSRKTKEAGSSIYLLDRLNAPAILIECGFISNTEECEALCNEEYRKKLVISIFDGIMQFISEENLI